jgi:hypothetical protein
MKLGESGMPDESFWETLFHVNLILDRLEIDKRVGEMVELGCGYGTFTLLVARRVSGTLRTYDIDGTTGPILPCLMLGRHFAAASPNNSPVTRVDWPGAGPASPDGPA